MGGLVVWSGGSWGMSGADEVRLMTASLARHGPLRRRLERVIDLVIPWGLGLLYGLHALDVADGRVERVVGVALAVALAVALTWRRRWPEPVAAVVLVVELVYQWTLPGLVIVFAGMAAVWSLTLVRPPRVSLVGLAGLLGAAGINFRYVSAGDAEFSMALAFSVWALAEAARSRIVAERETVQRAIRDEQARVATELHDVLAHSVSVIVVQAAAADDVFDSRPDKARESLRLIEGTGRAALRELRRLLGAVRSGTDVSLPQSPQPRLARLEELAQQLRGAGLEVRVTSDAAPPMLPAGVDLSAYRIIQEALTNTLRHARANLAEVTVRYGVDAVDIEVVDDGRAGKHRSGPDAGFGIIGMRERAAALGGSLEAGPTAHGGFRVRAHLPIDVAP